MPNTEREITYIVIQAVWQSYAAVSPSYLSQDWLKYVWEYISTIGPILLKLSPPDWPSIYIKLHSVSLSVCHILFVPPSPRTTFQEGRDLKIDTLLPWFILGTSIMSKTNKTPLRNLQRPLRLLGWRSGEPRS